MQRATSIFMNIYTRLWLADADNDNNDHIERKHRHRRRRSQTTKREKDIAQAILYYEN